MDILHDLGKYGPMILSAITWYNLWNRNNLFFYFTIGLVINKLINIILKGIIQDPRPLFDSEKVNLVKTNAKQYFYQNGIPFNIYGMPSGHAQTSFYTLAFTYLATKNNSLLFFYLIFAGFICYKRLELERHSLPQVVVGSAVGSFIGYIMYSLARGKLTGKIREKLDDNGPI